MPPAFVNVIVHDVDELRKYHSRLLLKKQQITTLLEELSSDCRDQNRNWDDSQYRTFDKQLERYTSGADRQLEDLQEAIDMVAAVLRRLE